MTIDQFVLKLRRQLEEFKSKNIPFQLAVYDTVAKVSDRAFHHGKDNNGRSYQYADSWYKQYRKDKGRETAFVNWRFQGDLKSDYENAPKGSERSEGAKPTDPPAVMINPMHYRSQLVRDNNDVKYKYLSERFGNFLELSKEEEANFYRLVELNTRNYFSI